MRIELSKGTCIMLPIGSGRLQCFISEVIGKGANSIVYNAHYYDKYHNQHLIRIKECYPVKASVRRQGCELTWENAIERDEAYNTFRKSYERLNMLQNISELRNSTVHVFELVYANNTWYQVMDLNITENDFATIRPNNPTDYLKVARALARVIGKYHSRELLHLDIKPDNFIILPETPDMVVLFDVDTVVHKKDLTHDYEVSFSDGWAAPEQIQSKVSRISEATDIYAIGAILFYYIMGRTPESKDRSVFSEWDFDNVIMKNMNPTLINCLRNIFHHTLCSNPPKRYQNTFELEKSLDYAIKVSMEDIFLVSNIQQCTSTFIGREEEIEDIKRNLATESSAVFIRSEGGMGKTELAKKYAANYRYEYDAICFLRYEGNLQQSIESLPIINRRESVPIVQLLNHCLCNQKVLLIIDNFDDDGDPYLDTVLSMNWNIILTTRNDLSAIYPKGVYYLNLNSLKRAQIITLFETELRKELTDKESNLLDSIIFMVKGLTIALLIISKEIVTSGTSIHEFHDRLEKSGLRALNEEYTKIRLKYKNRVWEERPIDIIKVVFDNSKLSVPETQVLKNLLVFHPKFKLHIDSYIKYSQEKDLSALNSMINKNWVMIDEHSFITLHPVIAELAEQEYGVSCTNVPGIYSYCKAIIKILESSSSIFEFKIQIPDMTDMDKKDAYQFLAVLLEVYSKLVDTDSDAVYHSSLINNWVLKIYKNEGIYGIRNLFMSVETLDVYRDIEIDSFKEEHERYTNIILSKNMNRLIKDIQSNCLYLLDNTIFDKYRKSKNSLLYNFLSIVPFYRNHLEKMTLQTIRHILLIKISNVKMLDDTIPAIIKRDGNGDSDKQIEFNKCFFLDLFENKFDTSVESFKGNIFFFSRLLKAPDYSSDGECETDLKSRNFYPLVSNSVILSSSVYLGVLSCYLETAKHLKYGGQVGSIFNNIKFPEVVDLWNLVEVSNRDTLIEELYQQISNLEIVIEEALGRFRFFRTYDDALEYHVASEKEFEAAYNVYKSLSREERSELWYQSVINELEISENPYNIYRTLLNLDYLKDHLPNSYVYKLTNSGFIDYLSNDIHLTKEQKFELLIQYPAEQLYNRNKSKYFYAHNKGKFVYSQAYIPVFHLYAKSLSSAKKLLEESINTGDLVDQLFYLNSSIYYTTGILPLSSKELILPYWEKNNAYFGMLPSFLQVLECDKPNDDIGNYLLDHLLYIDNTGLERDDMINIPELMAYAKKYKRSDVMNAIRNYIYISSIDLSQRNLSGIEYRFDRIAWCREFISDYLNQVGLWAYYRYYTISDVYPFPIIQDRYLAEHLNEFVNLLELPVEYYSLGDRNCEQRSQYPLMIEAFFSFDAEEIYRKTRNKHISAFWNVSLSNAYAEIGLDAVFLLVNKHHSLLWEERFAQLYKHSLNCHTVFENLKKGVVDRIVKKINKAFPQREATINQICYDCFMNYLQEEFE